jgi:methylase of polypeptide subunit release factors
MPAGWAQRLISARATGLKIWPAKTFDLIVSNPPYVAAGDPHLELNGLSFEPQMALTDGADGLDCIRRIVSGAVAHLKPAGWLLFEHGYDQGEASRNLLTTAAFKTAFTHPDLAGIDRVSRCLSLIWRNHVRRTDSAFTTPSPPTRWFFT